MATYSYPTSVELTAIGQEFMGALTLNDPLFQRHMPVVNVNSHLLEWEQMDNFRGLQQPRGLNGEPPRVTAVGGKRYLARPGVYGEFLPVEEDELTSRREWGTFGTPMDLTSIVTEKERQLVVREVARIRQIGWSLMSSGSFSVLNAHGVVVHTDTFTLQTASAAVAWATLATAKPLFDFRALKLLGRGRGVNFGRQAVAYANQVTVNEMLSNTNANDLGGKRIATGGTYNTLTDFNRIFADDDLPQIEVMDDGYIDDSGTFQLFIPDHKVVVVGVRPDGQTIAEYRRTRNANNPGMAPGPYDLVYEGPKPPKHIEVHRGMNGGPVLYLPSAIVILTTS